MKSPAKTITIGVCVHSEPPRLLATLASLRDNTTTDHKLILLPDGPDESTQDALQELSNHPQLSTTEPSGTAACFNRLAQHDQSDVIVLIESGSLVAPGWLEYLLDALDDHPDNGLAGPTTNLSWNEQCVYPRAVGTPAGIRQTAREARTRFGVTMRTLEPLYSLSDFCYVVRREVIDSIGAADERYGLGPCWEMDYNIRAARAGFRGVWVCGAYVHRLPFTARRSREEARRFEASKQRYQDNFCGARIRGEKSDFRNHCRGTDCVNFAPADLINTFRSWTQIYSKPAPALPIVSPPQTAHEPDTVKSVVGVNTVAVSDPLISCIMPTYNRRTFVPQAIRGFLRQDYANKELVIVDDGTDPVEDCIPVDDRIRYIRLDRRLTTGAKRNLACSKSQGELIAHWDDDDWYPSNRLSRQVSGLAEHGADICGSSKMLFCDTAGERAFEYAYVASGNGWVGGSTLAYQKSFWNRNNFPDITIGEDSRFIWDGRTKNIFDFNDPTLCIAMIHSGNTSPKATDGTFWHSTPFQRVRELLGDELNFYHATGAAPLISCIMPTFNRRHFVQIALKLFQQQDYPNKELVIVDDGDDSIEDLAKASPDVRYIRSRFRMTVGAKRNRACEEARGEIIAHWDDDDWYSPDRLRYQAAPILAGKAEITGLENSFILDLHNGQFWSTLPSLHKRMFVGNVHGGTIVFSKKLLSEKVRYPEVNLAEDAWLLRQSMLAGRSLVRLSNPGVFVYMRHDTNAWREFSPGRFIDPAGWRKLSRPGFLSSELVNSYKEAFRSL